MFLSQSEYYSYLLYVLFCREVKQESTLPHDYLQYWISLYNTNNIYSWEEYQQNLTESEQRALHQSTSCNKFCLHSFSYYKEYPHIEIALRLQYIHQFGILPSLDQGLVGYTDNQVECKHLSLILPDLKQLLNNISNTSNESEHLATMNRILLLLQPHGIQHLLGVRHTIGSRDILYPPKNILYVLFNQLHHPKATLTVGARALSKHSIRCISNWGEMKGPERIQNDIASATLDRLLEHAIWINIHQLPHDVICLEVRNKDGFGGRWDLTNHRFRGFVEPYMENGYASKWRHNTL